MQLERMHGRGALCAAGEDASGAACGDCGGSSKIN